MDPAREALELLALASDAAKQPMHIAVITRCEISRFLAIQPTDTAPVAYVADRQDAALLARAPELLRALAVEVVELRTQIADATVRVPWEAGYPEFIPTAGDPVRSIKELIEHVKTQTPRQFT